MQRLAMVVVVCLLLATGLWAKPTQPPLKVVTIQAASVTISRFSDPPWEETTFLIVADGLTFKISGKTPRQSYSLSAKTIEDNRGQQRQQIAKGNAVCNLDSIGQVRLRITADEIVVNRSIYSLPEVPVPVNEEPVKR